MSKYLIILSTIILVTLLSCSDETVTGQAESLTYGDLTEMEHVITNLEASFANKDIDRYKELLHEEYQHCSASRIRGRNWEVTKNQNMFNSELGILFEFSDGVWKEVKQFDDMAFEGCLETYRICVKRATKNGKLLEGVTDDHYRLVIAPINIDGLVKYKLYKSIHIRDADWDAIMTEWQ